MMIKIEVWKPIIGFEDLYLISDCGRIKAIHNKYKNRVMSFQINRNGYYSVKLSKNKIYYHLNVHRLVYEAFKGKIEIEDLIHHKDDNKLNNSLDNLEKTTRSLHKKIHRSIGIESRFKKLYHFDEAEIINLYERYTTIEIAKMKNCNQKTIERIIKKTKGSLYNKYIHRNKKQKI